MLALFVLSLLCSEVVLGGLIDLNIGLTLSLQVTFSPCSTCTSACGSGTNCMLANGTTGCQCYGCVSNCPSGCTCSLDPIAPGSSTLFCNKTCTTACPLSLPSLLQVLPLCGLAPWNCPSSISIPTDLSKLSTCCLADANGGCSWNCSAALPIGLPLLNPCDGKCILDQKPVSCLAGTTQLTNTLFQTTCDVITSVTGLTTCGWTTNCGCQVSTTSSGTEMCGGYPKPANPCDVNAVASYTCNSSSHLLGGCNWEVTCVRSDSCDESCPYNTEPEDCPSGYKVRPGEYFNAVCTSDSTGKCVWQTNCVVDDCSGSCSSLPKPVSCLSNSLTLLASDLLSGVLCDCAKPTGSDKCQWVTTNCFPAQCLVSKVNDTLFCGTKKLLSPLLCNVNPIDICVKLSDGTCGWNYQPPTAECPILADVVNLVLGAVPTPTCGGKPRPSCSNGQVQSSKCGCAKTSTGCDWINNCEVSVPTLSLCSLRRSLDLGWLCGTNPVPKCCSDGSRFIPIACDILSNGQCSPSGYCDRTSIIDVDLSLVANVTAGVRTCAGADEPKCTSGTPITPSQCVCTDSSSGRICQWSPIICSVTTPCDTCDFPCSANQYIASGNCISSSPPATRSVSTSVGNCTWSGLVCRDKPVPQSCTCENIPPTTCPCGQKRDTTIAPICLLDSLKRCVLQSKCVPDTCGGIGVDACKCDYSKCVFLSVGANASVGNLGVSLGLDVGLAGLTGCYDPQSDVLRAILSVGLPGVAVDVSVSIPGRCTSPTPVPTPAPCGTCSILEKVKAAISDQTRISAALQVFVDTQLQLRNTIDKQTGCALGKHFALSLAVVANPVVRADASLDLNVVVNFLPLENILTPTDDHKRFFCPCVKKFLTSLASFTEQDVLNVNCVWNSLVSSLKRGELVQDSSSSNSYTSSVNYPSPAVQRAYPDNSTATSSAEKISEKNSFMKIVVGLVGLMVAMINFQ